MYTVGNFSNWLVECFLLLSSGSRFRRCCSLCWHCDSSDSLPGHFCGCGPICVSEESSWLWVWYYRLFCTQWRLSACEYQGSKTRSVDIALHTCGFSMEAVSLCGVKAVQLRKNISSMQTEICSVSFITALASFRVGKVCRSSFFSLNRFLCHTFKLWKEYTDWLTDFLSLLSFWQDILYCHQSSGVQMNPNPVSTRNCHPVDT